MGKTVAYFLQVFVVHALLNGDVEEITADVRDGSVQRGDDRGMQ